MQHQYFYEYENLGTRSLLLTASFDGMLSEMNEIEINIGDTAFGKSPDRYKNDTDLGLLDSFTYSFYGFSNARGGKWIVTVFSCDANMVYYICHSWPLYLAYLALDFQH